MDVSEVNTLEVEVERILPGGLGLAHAAGLTVLVSLSAPGDRLRVKIDRVRGKVAFASIVEIQRPSPVRIDPPCPYFGRCGGCDFQQLLYEAQLRAKSEMICDCLHRIARIQSPPEVRVVASPKEWRYRSRANWQVDPAIKRIGYYERGTHIVCDVADCAVLVPELQQVLESIRALLPDGLPDAMRELEAVQGDTNVSLEPETAGFGSRDVTRKIGAEKYQFSATSFFQTNHDLLEAVIATAIAGAQGHSAVDLYCGVGLFTLPLARRFARVVGIEANQNASLYARANLKNAGLGNARIMTARAGEWLNQNVHSIKPVDLLLLDPPRTGAESQVVQGILTLSPARIGYVSCDPATLARDLKELLAGGYAIESIVAFDMFPQTHHVETVVHLVKTSRHSNNS
jgi:23S rRNA (uracil1939-C5)-methyltransferase